MYARTNEQCSVHQPWPRPSVRGILDWLVALDARYRQRRTLETLDDRMLRDIGVTRAEVEQEIRRPLW